MQAIGSMSLTCDSKRGTLSLQEKEEFKLGVKFPCRSSGLANRGQALRTVHFVCPGF
jgi:hypothetical protein